MTTPTRSTSTFRRLRKGLIVTFATSAVFAAGWYSGRRTSGLAEGAVAGPLVAAGTDGSGAAKNGDTPGAPAKSSAVPVVASAKGLPDAAAKLLRSLDAAGGLKSQAAILQYASSLDAASARAAALSFRGKSWSSDKNTQQLSAAVFTRWAELDPQAVLESARTSGNQYFRWNAMSAGFDAMARKDPEAAWQAASTFGPLKAQAQRSVIQSISSQDPAAAFKLASEIKSRQGSWAMSSVMSAWADRDPAAAGEAARGLPLGQVRNQALDGLMERWAATDYDAAKAWAASLPTTREKVAATTSALQALAQMDPEKSLSLLNSADVGSGRGQVINQAITSLALKDFDQAISQASGFTNFIDKSSALAALAENASEENREKILKLAASLPANLARSIYQGGIWERAYSDPAGIVETVGKIPLASVREQATNQAVEMLSYYQPDEAMKLFGSLQSASQNPDMASQIASSVAWTDPEKAVAWAEKLGTEALKKSALVAAISNWSQNDPEKAGQEISKIQNPDTRAEVARSVAASLANRSLAEAEKWAGSLSGVDQSAALGKVVEQAANQAPDRVEALYARFTASLSPEDAARSENQAVAKKVATQIAETDAGKAAAWSLALPEGGARDEAVSGVVSTWAGYDAVAASQWVQNLPEGKGRDMATGNLVNTIAKDDPESAWAWASSITDNARRREAAAAALAGWKANGNRAAAQAALDAAGFSESDHQELQRKLE